MAQNTTFYCPSGGDWYACLYGSKFAGCCAIDPCTSGCPQADIYPLAFRLDLYGRFPDATCERRSIFYTCARSENATFAGCCKSNACTQDPPGCAQGNISPIIMSRQDEYEFYGNPDFNNIGQPPVTTSSLVLVGAVPTVASFPAANSERVGRKDALASVSVSTAFPVVIAIALLLWLCYRKYCGSQNTRWSSVESTQLHSEAAIINKAGPQAECHTVSSNHTAHDMNRLGSGSLFILAATIVVQLALCSFLLFLWFGKATNKTWSLIMVDGWATRSIAVTALLLRTAVDLQAAIGTAFLASLYLESRVGIQLSQVANISPMRAGSTSPWSLVRCAGGDVWKSRLRYKQHYGLYVSGVLLVLTTSALQFSSTMLLSDLKLGPLVAHQSTSEMRTSLSYAPFTEKIPRDSAWTTNPPSFQAFGEYHEPIASIQDGLADTGLLLRAFLPYAASESRQRLSTYSGNALVLDARVSCQVPVFTEVNGNVSIHSHITGLVKPSKNATMLQEIVATPFGCTIAGNGQLTICQIAHSRENFTGSLTSQFNNSTAFGTTFLVFLGSRNTTMPLNPWLDLPSGDAGNMHTSATLCFAPWDAAVLDVNMVSEMNRSEPQLEYNTNSTTMPFLTTTKPFLTQSVLDHFFPAAKNGTRQMLQMQRPHSYTGDLPPRYRRPLVQSDIGSSSAAEASVPLPANWTVSMTGAPLVTLLRSFSEESRPSQIVSADPALAAIFYDAFNSTSIEWAMSSLITILSLTNYYGQQPAFDRLDNVTVSFFENVLYPQDHLGLTILMWLLAAHIAVTAVLLVFFVQKTRLTLVGNAWPAFAQIAASQDVMENMAGASGKTDSEILEDLKNAGKGHLRARVVWRGEGAEVVLA